MRTFSGQTRLGNVRVVGSQQPSDARAVVCRVCVLVVGPPRFRGPPREAVANWGVSDVFWFVVWWSLFLLIMGVESEIIGVWLGVLFLLIVHRCCCLRT